MSLVFYDIVNQVAGNWYLCLWFLAERYAYGVTNAIGKQRTYSHSTLYPAVFALTGFRNTEMEGIVHALRVHLTDKQTYGSYHDHSIACLYGNHHIVKLL